MDLDDVHGNSRDGIHTAAMRGSWLSVVYEFAGFRDRTLASNEASAIDQTLESDLALAGNQVRCTRETESQAQVPPSSEASKAPLAFRHKKELIVLKPGE
jgi:alpha,alpha-trehalose phosphorylase